MFENDIQNPLVDSLRKKLEDTLQVDTSEISNEELLFKYGQDLRKNGYTMSNMRSEYGNEFTDQYFDIKNRPRPDQSYLGEIGSGFKEQGYGLLGMPFQAAGLAAGAVGDAVGVDLGVEDYLMETGSNIAQKGQEDPRTLQSIDDVRWDNPSEVARFLLGGIGAAAPSVLESAAVFTGAGGVGYGIAKSRAKKALGEIIKNKVDKNADESLKDVFQELVKQKAKQGFITGSNIGLTTSSIGLGVGEIYGELYQYTQLDPNDPDYVSPTTARSLSASFGTLSGSLDAIGAGKLLSRMTGASPQKATEYYKRLLRGLPEGVFIEGGTEVAQEFLNLAAEKYAKGEELEFTDQEIIRMMDAGVLGAIGGTGFSAIGAMPGPKKPQEQEVGSEEIASESKEVKAQRELLDTMKEESIDSLRYQVGDKVQTAYGQKGVVKEVRAEESVVEMADGTIREIRNDRLAEALEPPVVEPPKVDPDKAKQDVAKPKEVVPEPVIPKHEEPSAEEQFVELEGLNGSAVKVTPQTKKDIATLLKYYRKWQKEDMYTFKGRSKVSGKGWESSDFKRMEIKLGPDRALIRGKRGITNKAALVELGYLDNNGNWHKETPADRSFVKEEFQKLKDARLKVIADNDYIAPGKKVKTAGRILGEIESITKDGHVVVDGEEYDPKRLYRVKESKPKPIRDPQDPGNSNPAPSLNFLGTEEDVSDKDVTYFYYMKNGRLSQTTKKLGKYKDRESIKVALLDMLAKELPKGKSAVGNAAKIRIGNEEFLAAYDDDGFDFGSIKITKTEIEQAQIDKRAKEDRDNGKKGEPQKTSLSEPIFTKVADEDNPDTVFDENGEDALGMLTDLVDYDDIVGESGSVGGNYSRNISQLTKSKALLILKGKGKGRGDKLRIVSVGHPHSKNKVPYVYDGTRQGDSRKRYIELTTMLKDWDITGKLVSNKAVPYTDVLYPDSDAFNNDPIIRNAVEAIDSQVSEDKADLELTHEIQKANKEEAQLDDTIAAIQQRLKELEGNTDPDIQASPADEDSVAAEIAQLKAQLEVLLNQKEQLARERKTAVAKKKVRMVKGEAQGRGAVREGVDGTEEGGEGFTASTTMAENVNRGDVSKIWVKYLHKLTPNQFEHVLDIRNTVAPAGSKRGKNAKKIFESVGRSSGAKEFFSLVRDMVGGTETGKKDLIASYNENPTLFDNYLTKLYQRLINDNATKAYKKDGKIVADPMDTDKRDVLRDMLIRYFKQRGDTAMKTVDLMSYEQARRGDETDVTLQEPPVPQQTPEPAPVEEEAPPSKNDIRAEKFKQLKDTLKAYELPVDVGLFAGLMKVDLGPAINKSPDEVYEAALDEILYNLNIESELDGVDRESFMEFFKNRTSIEDIAVMFDQGSSKIVVAEEQNQGDSIFMDGYELDHVNVDEGRLNPNRSRVPIIDPTTGRREITQTGTTSLEAIDHSYSEARRDPRRYIAQVENPVAKHPGRVEEAQAAMRRFAPLDGPFSAQVAIRQIIDQFPHLGYITNVARMLSDNKFLDGYTVELVPWEQYRPYARVNGTLTRAVHIRNQKKIIISDAYWGINETLKSDEALAAVILHELLHPALNPVLDIVLELQGCRCSNLRGRCTNQGISYKSTLLYGETHALS
jgi:preprotein translocase subunit YajC